MKPTGRQISQDFSDKDLKSYIGRPYEQVDCWDLVREFYLNEFDLELNKVYGGPSHLSVEESAALITSSRGQFVKVDSPQFGDLMGIKLYGIECHVGIFIGGGKFLHSVKTTGSVLDRIDRFKHLIAGYFRHRGLSDKV